MSAPRYDRDPRIADPRSDPRVRPVEVAQLREGTGWLVPATIAVLLLCGILLFAYNSRTNTVANPNEPVSTTGQNMYPAVNPRQLSPDGVPTPPPSGTPGRI
jgi:hypothetical protein